MPQTVLIVDDSPTAGPELLTLFEGEGYTTLLAMRANEALDIVQSTKIDLIVTETMLPGMDGFDLVRHLRRRGARSDIPIIMLSVRSATEDYAAAFEAGADEYFLKPIEPPKILAAARGLITRYELARASSELAVPRTRQRRGERGKIITVFSLKGGVGASTIAVNLAVAIKRLAPSSQVGLIDLALEQGTDSLLLDVVPTSTLYDWSRERMDEANANLLHQYFVQHGSGVSLLAAPSSPEQAETVRPDTIRTTLRLAPESFEYVVLDTASTFAENSLMALEAAQHIILPVTPDMPALKTAVNTLRILKAVNIDEGRIQVVMNEIVPRAGLTRQQVETSVGRPVLSLPHAGSLFIDAANHGSPAVLQDATLPPVKAFLDIARTVCEPELVETEGQKSKGGLLDRLRPRVKA